MSFRARPGRDGRPLTSVAQEARECGSHPWLSACRSPTAGPRTSSTADSLGLEAIGEPAEDGLPEPLQFALTTGCRPDARSQRRLRLGDRRARSRHRGPQRVHARPGAARTRPKWTNSSNGCEQAGAEVVTEPGQQPWGYAGAFARPRRAPLDGRQASGRVDAPGPLPLRGGGGGGSVPIPEGRIVRGGGAWGLAGLSRFGRGYLTEGVCGGGA